MLTLPKKQPKKLNYYQAPEYQQFLILRLLNLIMIGLLLAASMGTIWFIHKNIYNTIGQAEIIISKQGNLVTEVINFDKYEKVKQAWTIKTTPTEWPIRRDPFNSIKAVVSEK